MFNSASAFDQDLGWCVGDGVGLYQAFDDTPCESTSCGVTQVAGGCAPTPAPTTLKPTVTFAPTVSPLIADDTNIRTAVAAWLSDSASAKATYGHISTWETGGVTDMERLFEGAYDFNEDIGAWDTSAVTDMSDMFNYAWDFNQDLGDWSVAAVTDMSGMFYSASDFNRDLSDWSVAAVTDMSEMFKKNTILTSTSTGAWTKT